MKILLSTLIFILILFILPTPLKAQVTIGDTMRATDPSAVLELYSQSKGFLPPRLTTAQRDSISSPADGLIVFDTDLNRLLYYHDGWKDLGLWLTKDSSSIYYPAHVAIGPGSDTSHMDATLNITGSQGINSNVKSDGTIPAHVFSDSLNNPTGFSTNFLVNTYKTGAPSHLSVGMYSYMEGNDSFNIAVGGQSFYSGSDGDLSDIATGLPGVIGTYGDTYVLDTNATVLSVGTIGTSESSHLGINIGNLASARSPITYANIGLLSAANDTTGGVLPRILNSFPTRFTAAALLYNPSLTANDFTLYSYGNAKSYFGGNVGIGTSSPVEKLDVNGGIRIGNTSSTHAGTLRWNSSNFQGYNGSAWVNLGGLWNLSSSTLYPVDSLTKVKIGPGSSSGEPYSLFTGIESDSNWSSSGFFKAKYTGSGGTDIGHMPGMNSIHAQTEVSDSNAGVIAIAGHFNVATKQIGINLGVFTQVSSQNTHANIGVFTNINQPDHTPKPIDTLIGLFPNRFTVADLSYNHANDTSDFNIYAGGNAKSYFGGNVGIGTVFPTTTLDVAGTINASAYLLNGDTLGFGGGNDAFWDTSVGNLHLSDTSLLSITLSVNDTVGNPTSSLILNSEGLHLLSPASDTLSSPGTISVWTSGDTSHFHTTASAWDFDPELNINVTVDDGTIWLTNGENVYLDVTYITASLDYVPYGNHNDFLEGDSIHCQIGAGASINAYALITESDTASHHLTISGLRGNNACWTQSSPSINNMIWVGADWSGKGYIDSTRFDTTANAALNVGIGTFNPAYKLDVVGAVNATSYLLNGNPLALDGTWSATDSTVYIGDTTINIGIGTSSPASKLDVAGAINANAYLLNGDTLTLDGAWSHSGTDIYYDAGRVLVGDIANSLGLRASFNVFGSAVMVSDTSNQPFSLFSFNANDSIHMCDRMDSLYNPSESHILLGVLDTTKGSVALVMGSCDEGLPMVAMGYFGANDSTGQGIGFNEELDDGGEEFEGRGIIVNAEAKYEGKRSTVFISKDIYAVTHHAGDYTGLVTMTDSSAGIASLTPGYVIGESGRGSMIATDTNNIALWVQRDDSLRVWITEHGVGINTNNPNTELQVNGNIRQKITTSDVSNPPTISQVESLFGDADDKGDGWTGYLKDSDSDNLYQVMVVGSDWYVVGTIKLTN